MSKLTLFLKLLLLEFKKGTHLVALYDLRHALTVWAAVILTIAIGEFVTNQIGIPTLLFAATYAYVLNRIAYVFGIDEHAKERLQDDYAY